MDTLRPRGKTHGIRWARQALPPLHAPQEAATQAKEIRQQRMKILPFDGLTLSDNQLKVLRALAERYDQTGWGENEVPRFRTLAKELKIEERLVRLASRALTRKGLAEYVRGLIFTQGDKEGMLAGSGYSCTKTGFEVVERIDEYWKAKNAKL